MLLREDCWVKIGRKTMLDDLVGSNSYEEMKHKAGDLKS